MPVNWKAEDAYTRLLAAIVAANDLKVRQHHAPSSHHFQYHSRGSVTAAFPLL